MLRTSFAAYGLRGSLFMRVINPAGLRVFSHFLWEWFFLIRCRCTRSPQFKLGNREETGWIEAMRFTLDCFCRCVAALLSLSFGVCNTLGQDAQSAETILPGVGIGHVILGQTQGDVHARLGTPKLSAAGFSGRVWEIWRSGVVFDGKRQNGVEELEVYFARDPANPQGDSMVWQIRAISPFFQTTSGISIRNSYAEISNAFPKLGRDERLTDLLNDERSEKNVEIFVDETDGIAFEFRNGATADPNARGYCLAIHVFRPGTEPRVMQAFDQGAQTP